MLQKEKKGADPAASAAPAPVATNGAFPTPVDTSSSAAAMPPTPPAATVSTPAAPAAPAAAPVDPAAVADLIAISGASQAECEAALNAAGGDPNLAFNFLTDGIPDHDMGAMGAMDGMDVDDNSMATPPAATAASAAASGTGTGLDALRSHPQFNALRQTVQSNPTALPQILNVIGQQQPELLAAIHADEASFLAMMNEPVDATPAAAPTAAPGAAPGAGGMPDMSALGGMGGGGGEPNPAQLLAILQQLPAEQQQAFAAQMGMNPDQLRQLMEALSQMPPEQLAAMRGGMGGPGGGGGPPPGTIQLTQAEIDCVERLESMGFSRQQAIQAYLSCDKNEDLAANMLLDGGFNDDEDDYA
jgi:UV excision repair protein RAD23